MRACSAFTPACRIEEVRERTGFEFRVSPTLRVTDPPAAEELRLIREEIDPLGVRRLEFLSGPERLKAIDNILSFERSTGDGIP